MVAADVPGLQARIRELEPLVPKLKAAEEKAKQLSVVENKLHKKQWLHLIIFLSMLQLGQENPSS